MRRTAKKKMAKMMTRPRTLQPLWWEQAWLRQPSQAPFQVPSKDPLQFPSQVPSQPPSKVPSQGVEHWQSQIAPGRHQCLKQQEESQPQRHQGHQRQPLGVEPTKQAQLHLGERKKQQRSQRPSVRFEVFLQTAPRGAFPVQSIVVRHGRRYPE